MFLPDDTTYNTSTEPIVRSSRTNSRREMINEKRQRNTDFLSNTDGLTTNGNTPPRQIAHLREENKRLRWQLDEAQHIIFQHRQAQAQLEKNIETLKKHHQQEIEQYELQLHEIIDERNQIQEEKQEWEQRYKNLYHSFHDSVEEEANKMVEEAAHTLVLSPEHTPALLRDVAKTLEFQVKQTEDQHVAELLSLMRQAQYKAELLEQELAYEREKIAAERQNILVQQLSISEHAQLRYKTLRQHLQARWTIAFTFMTAALLLLLVVLQLTFLSMNIPLGFSLLVPVGICVVVALIFANTRAQNNLRNATKKLAQTTTTTAKKV